jgi:hypothetical protein
MIDTTTLRAVLRRAAGRLAPEDSGLPRAPSGAAVPSFGLALSGRERLDAMMRASLEHGHVVRLELPWITAHMLTHPAQIEEQIDLHVDAHLVTDRLDLRPEVDHIEDVTGGNPRPVQFHHTDTGVLRHAMVERDPGNVDQLVAELGGDDLPTQPVSTNLVGEAFA